MRYWILGLVVLSVFALVVVQCGGWGYWELDGDNGGGCGLCAFVVCANDGNECTEDECVCETGMCGVPVDPGMVCNRDGSSGVCIDGLCEVDTWCEGECDDNNECTANICNIENGLCDPETPVPIDDGTLCGGGFCRDGTCGTLVDQCTPDDLEAIEVDDEPDADEVVRCSQVWYDTVSGEADEGLGCITAITNCIQESGTSLSSECSSCFALRECCMMNECGCESPEPHCDACIQERCQPHLDACVGGR